MSLMNTPGPSKKATDLEIVKALDDQIKTHDAPVARANQISKRLKIGTQHCRDRLAELEEEGVVSSLKTGSGKVWWINFC